MSLPKTDEPIAGKSRNACKLLFILSVYGVLLLFVQHALPYILIYFISTFVP